jgi:hypothetical protein
MEDAQYFNVIRVNPKDDEVILKAFDRPGPQILQIGMRQFERRTELRHRSERVHGDIEASRKRSAACGLVRAR